MLRAQLADLTKVSFGRDDDSRLPLNWFQEDRSDVFAMQLERSSDVIDLAISDCLDRIAITVRRPHTLEVWSESISALRVRAHASPISLHQHVTDSQEESISYLMTPIVRPWKLPAALKTIARPSGTSFFS